MEKDVAPELYDKITRDVNKGLNENSEIRDLLKKIKNGKADYKDMDELAYEYGKVYSESLSKNLTSGTLPDGKMYYNIAERTIRPTLEECYGNVASAATETQRIVNKSSGINIAPQKATLNNDRIAGIIDRATEAEQFDDVSWILKDPVVNFSQSVVDDTVKTNAEFHSKAGLSSKIVRTAEHKCCKWCSSLAGTYDYPDDIPDDIFRRHENCRCTVEMHSEKGIQNAHTKKWRDPKEYETIEERKQVGISEFSSKEKTAINWYKSAESYSVNDSLRNGAELSAGQKEMVKNLDSVLEKLPMYEGTVYRSLDTSMMNMNAFWAEHEVGSKVKYSAYTSCSTKTYDKNMQIQEIIECKTGRDFRKQNPDENEILYERNKKFIITKIEGNTIWLKESE